MIMAGASTPMKCQRAAWRFRGLSQPVGAAWRRHPPGFERDWRLCRNGRRRGRDPGRDLSVTRIHDAFAIVDAGAPGVEVLLDNRPIGSTNWLGKAVVPDLRSFQRSKTRDFAGNHPGRSHVTITVKDVIPGYRGASILRVNTVAAQDTARVVIHDEKGQLMPVGAIVTHKETGAVYGVGYGGMTYIPGIGNTNTLVVQHGDRSCEASFTRKIAAAQPVGSVRLFAKEDEDEDPVRGPVNAWHALAMPSAQAQTCTITRPATIAFGNVDVLLNTAVRHHGERFRLMHRAGQSDSPRLPQYG